MGILQRHPFFFFFFFFCKSYGFARLQTKSGWDEQLMKHSIREKKTEGWMQTKSSNELLMKNDIRK